LILWQHLEESNPFQSIFYHCLKIFNVTINSLMLMHSLMCELNSHTNSVGVSVVLIGDGLLTGFDGCFSALHYTSCSRTEVDDMIRKFTNVLLTRTLGGCMASLIRRPCLTLLQVRLLLHKYSSYNDLSLQLFLVA